MLANTTADDLVICLISGGCSALLTAPLLSLADWQTVNQTLLASGCSIHTFNRIRQHLDEVKGGGLLNWAMPAPVYGLILSDVIGDDLSIIGSGPTVPGTDTAADAIRVLEQYHIAKQVDTNVWKVISKQLSVNSYQSRNRDFHLAPLPSRQRDIEQK